MGSRHRGNDGFRAGTQGKGRVHLKKCGQPGRAARIQGRDASGCLAAARGEAGQANAQQGQAARLGNGGRNAAVDDVPERLAIAQAAAYRSVL